MAIPAVPGASARAAELTAAESSQIVDHVRPCWPPSNDILPSSTSVTIDVVTETDGTAIDATGMVAASLLFSGAYGPAERMLTSLAKQAILDPRCSRLPIPTRLLGHRQSVRLVFAP